MKNKNQVELHKLIFTLNWEDPKSDIKALEIKPGETVMTITSGGCNSIEFLLYDPSAIYAIDINPAQSFLMELKKASFQQLDYNEFSDLMGLTAGHDRKAIYAKVRAYLPEPAQAFWDTQSQIIDKGIVMAGRYEAFVKLAGRVLKFLQGKKNIQLLFAEKTAIEQQHYFDTVFDTWQFKAVFRLLFNKRMLARKGLSADYFHFDDGSRSFAESFYNRAKNAMRNIPIQDNYFLALYLLGKYRNHVEIPEYLKETNFAVLKERVSRIQVITMDAKDWLHSATDDSVNCFSLSNICELKSESDAELLFNEIARAGKNRGRVCFRNLMIPREVPEPLKNVVVKNTDLSKKLLADDRSFVYGKVAAYYIRKASFIQN